MEAATTGEDPTDTWRHTSPRAYQAAMAASLTLPLPLSSSLTLPLPLFSPTLLLPLFRATLHLRIATLHLRRATLHLRRATLHLRKATQLPSPADIMSKKSAVVLLSVEDSV